MAKSHEMAFRRNGTASNLLTRWSRIAICVSVPNGQPYASLGQRPRNAETAILRFSPKGTTLCQPRPTAWETPPNTKPSPNGAAITWISIRTQSKPPTGNGSRTNARPVRSSSIGPPRWGWEQHIRRSRFQQVERRHGDKGLFTSRVYFL